jgi:hypothetical protein
MNKFSITNYELRVKKKKQGHKKQGHKQDTMTNNQDANRNNNRNNKYDLEDRATAFAKRVIKLLKCLPKIP